MKPISFRVPKKRLALAVLALAGASQPLMAQLLDHGPADPTLIWPQWYRASSPFDAAIFEAGLPTNGAAVGLCKSQVASLNAAAFGAPMCFPITPDAAAFAGNVGPEIFYNMINYVQKPGAAGGFNFRYMGALEASYVPGPNPVHGQETVFARIRVSMNFNDPSFNGDYTVVHPFGTEHFPNVQATDTSNVQGAQTSLFATFDVPLGTANDFNAALGGPIGPFIQWDVLNAGETLTVGGQQFLGDPNYAHTFTGSPFTDDNGNPQNYIQVIGPNAALLNSTCQPGDTRGTDGLLCNVLTITEANILGQVWTAPIASNLVVEQAVKARSPAVGGTGKNSVDVWATSAPGHKLYLTGVGLPSMEMIEDQTAHGHYHGHIEYSVGQELPASVTVTDNTSVPIVSSEHQLVDGVEISVATYDTPTGNINIKAKSTDEVGPLPAMLVENIPGVTGAAAALTSATCAANAEAFPGATPLDKCFHMTLATTVEPPKFIAVRSSEGGTHDDQLVMVTGNPQNITINVPVQGNVTGNVNQRGAVCLQLSNFNDAQMSTIKLVTQPGYGVISKVPAAVCATGWQYAPNPNAPAGADSFKFVVQPTVNGAVSNLAIANLTLLFTAAAPTANLDQFAARVSTNLTTANFPRTLNVLANDVPATTDAPNQFAATGAVSIVTNPGRGTATANPNGTITYRATSAGTDSFTYRVKNAANQFSAPATVQMTNFAAAETITFKRAPDYTAGRWSAINGTTSWFGPNLTQTSVTCSLINSGGQALATPLQISAPAIVDAAGAYQVTGGVTTPAATATAIVRCTSTNGGTATSSATVK